MKRRNFETLVIPNTGIPHLKPEHIKLNEDYESLTTDQLIQRRKLLRRAQGIVEYETEKITKIISERVK